MTDPDVPGWPPVNADEMMIWQDLYGSDSAIAAAARVSDYTVATVRRGFGVESGHRPNQARVHDRTVRAGGDEARRLDALYRGRRYDD